MVGLMGVGEWRAPLPFALYDPATLTMMSVGSAIVGAGATLVGAGQQSKAAGVQSVGAIQAGIAEKNNNLFQAAQLGQQAEESRAAAQRVSMEHDRQTDLVQSGLQARAAASGAGASDPTVLNLSEDIAGRGELQSLMDMYVGENQARGLEDAARGKVVSGDAALTGAQYRARGYDAQGAAAWTSAAGTIAGQASSMFGKFAGLKPAYG